MVVPKFGVGLQYNPELTGWFPFFDQQLDVVEVLFDSLMAPFDGAGLMSTESAASLAELKAHFPLTGHSNYGGDFGFDALEGTVAASRHVPLAKECRVPWVSNHCFYSDASWSDVWSSPIQFSKAEAIRVADRAMELQNLYGVPFGHENAAYYRTCPGSELTEEEFLATMIERSGTYLHLDLHNLYANELNHGKDGYSIERFLNVVPLDRVIAIHLAGGRWLDDQYHDLHDTKVPDPVWDLLAEVLSRTQPGAVILEYETTQLHENHVAVETERTIELICADIAKAQSAWDRAYGPTSRWSRRAKVA